MQHVQDNAAQYLAAVFAVVREWFSAGCPQGKVDHDFRLWCGTLEWMVTTVLGEEPLMDGHRGVQRRTTNPLLSWLRDVAHALDNRDKLYKWWRPNGLLDVLEDEGSKCRG